MKQGEFPLIFIIEDNPLFLKLVEEHLKLNNHRNFMSFKSASECMEHFYYSPDIIIMDYELGESDGLELLNFIKNRDKNTYVIMLTNSEDIGVALKALQAGAYDYIHKDELSFRLLKHIIGKIIHDHNSGIVSTSNEEMTGFKRFLRT